MQANYLFVYGTLTSAAIPLELQAIMAECGSFIGNAVLSSAQLYQLDGYPGAALCKNQDAKVFGEIYQISDSQKLFAVLDAYEECSPDFPEPHEYRRQQVTVTDTIGNTLIAWCYLYNRDTNKLKIIANGDYKTIS
jgi:gamma-glutamylcyclotransferase (GGCT)/AIG2-like uncharacterized protein YtfP